MNIWNTIKKIRARKLRRRHVDVAHRLTAHNTHWPSDISPEKMLEELLKEVQVEGWKLIHKPRLGPDILTRPTTAIWNTVFLGVGYAKLSTRGRVELLEHELNHLRYYTYELSVSFPMFLAQYAVDARYRWAVEASAKFGELLTRKFLGRRISLRDEVDSFIRFYRLGDIRGVKKRTHKYFLEAFRRAELEDHRRRAGALLWPPAD